MTAATAQIAGSTTTVGVSITETERVALGWSVRKSILGKIVYNDAGAKIAKVGFDPVAGARPLKRAISNASSPLLSKLLLHGSFGPKDTIRVETDPIRSPGQFSFSLAALPQTQANAEAQESALTTSD